jgi:hypothetical protein
MDGGFIRRAFERQLAERDGGHANDVIVWRPREEGHKSLDATRHTNLWDE